MRYYRFIRALGVCLLLAGCQTEPVEGEYVTFMREMMVESARLKDESGEGTERSEPLERAVRVWRGQQEEAQAR